MVRIGSRGNARRDRWTISASMPWRVQWTDAVSTIACIREDSSAVNRPAAPARRSARSHSMSVRSDVATAAAAVSCDHALSPRSLSSSGDITALVSAYRFTGRPDDQRLHAARRSARRSTARRGGLRRGAAGCRAASGRATRATAGVRGGDDLLDESPRADVNQLAHTRRLFGECCGWGSVHAGDRGSTRTRGALRPAAEPRGARSGSVAAKGSIHARERGKLPTGFNEDGRTTTMEVSFCSLPGGASPRSACAAT